mmetsp:Transcript_23630/g.66311  ORF Transcript_23630/g.66311 Transcript_23630/m.66311 type:complete len:238 (-) Transcript_23630:1942-2655(-)
MEEVPALRLALPKPHAPASRLPAVFHFIMMLTAACRKEFLRRFFHSGSITTSDGVAELLAVAPPDVLVDEVAADVEVAEPGRSDLVIDATVRARLVDAAIVVALELFGRHVRDRALHVPCQIEDRRRRARRRRTPRKCKAFDVEGQPKIADFLFERVDDGFESITTPVVVVDDDERVGGPTDLNELLFVDGELALVPTTPGRDVVARRLLTGLLEKGSKDDPVGHARVRYQPHDGVG